MIAGLLSGFLSYTDPVPIPVYAYGDLCVEIAITAPPPGSISVLVSVLF